MFKVIVKLSHCSKDKKKKKKKKKKKERKSDPWVCLRGLTFPRDPEE
jgi:hypothetical protein